MRLSACGPFGLCLSSNHPDSQPGAIRDSRTAKGMYCTLNFAIQCCPVAWIKRLTIALCFHLQGAVCLDGTPGGYYLRQGEGTMLVLLYTGLRIPCKFHY